MQIHRKQILIAGATGLIGSELTQKLVSLGYQVMVLARNPEKVNKLLPKSVGYIEWNGSFTNWLVREVEKSYAVINLTGEGIADKRWTNIRRIKLVRSRLGTTRALAKACSFSSTKPSVFIQASAIGYYPTSDGNISFDEDSRHGSGFLSRLTMDWESVARHEIPDGIRKVLLRTGIVLSNSGGLLPKLILPLKFYVGGWLGSGNQMLSWIHIHDHINAILFLLENSSCSGPYNLVSPSPVTMKVMVKSFAKAMHLPAYTSVPAFVIRILFGTMGEMVMLSSQQIVPKRLLDSGFQFTYPSINDAVDELVRKIRPSL